MLRTFFADLHIHIGRDMYGNPVKITGSKSLTITNILKEASRNKGIQMVGVIDCQAPRVQEEIKQLIRIGQAEELRDGGIRFEEVTLLLGAEIEIYDENCHGPIHVLCFLPTLEKMEQFTHWLGNKMTNINLSSQRYYGTAKELQYKVKQLSGIFIPAHVFTPFKSMYGKGVKKSLTEVFDSDLIDGIELGLSSDSYMADSIKELHAYSYLSNSDAHSLAKIAREYQEIEMKEPSFKEFCFALHHVHGRKIIRNFGMNPKLGKYYSTVCINCLDPLQKEACCPKCGSQKVIMGVAQRINELADTNTMSKDRPAYLHQVPLEYLPKLGPKTYSKLLSCFNTEMNIIHNVSFEDLKNVIPEKLAKMIIQMRTGDISIHAGGGGKYGSIETT